MRVEAGLLSVLLIFEIIGLAVFLTLLGANTPVNLSAYCGADLQVLASGKNVYGLFLMGPVVFGTAFCVGENRGGMSVVLWKSKKRLLRQQIIFCAVWSLLIATIAVVVPLVLASAWEKTGMNWEIVSSYFAIVNNAMLPEIQLWEVVAVNALVQWTRNMIFSCVVLLSYWWNGNLLYGILAVVCVCLIELKMPQMGIVLGLVKADYEFWLSGVQKILAVAAAVGWLGSAGGVLYYLQKGKEFV